MLKNCFACNLRIFVLSKSVCQTRLKSLPGTKHSISLQKRINYGEKSFITLGPGLNVIKLFMSVISQSVSMTSFSKQFLQMVQLSTKMRKLQRKTFYNTGPWMTSNERRMTASSETRDPTISGQWYKTFYGRKLCLFKIR
jgi:hypothetical protein